MSDVPRPDANPLRVLVVDADPRTRESLSGVLGIGRRCTVVGSTGDPAEALALCRELDPDVVVVDPRLPDIDRGRALIARLREQCPGVRVLVMAWSDSLEPGALPDGADAYVRKTFRPRELIDGVLAARR
jgi:DNA-binding NarL/FixJ family response regulator